MTDKPNTPRYQLYDDGMLHIEDTQDACSRLIYHYADTLWGRNAIEKHIERLNDTEIIPKTKCPTCETIILGCEKALSELEDIHQLIHDGVTGSDLAEPIRQAEKAIVDAWTVGVTPDAAKKPVEHDDD